MVYGNWRQTNKYHIYNWSKPSIEEDYLKFLGKRSFFRGKSDVTYLHIKEEGEKPLSTIDKILLRFNY